MSLQLRQAAEQTLQDNKLGNFHAGISSTRHLKITSNCGKPLCTLNGVKFETQTPTKKTVEYAIDLLSKYLLAHASTLHQLIDAREQHRKDLDALCAAADPGLLYFHNSSCDANANKPMYAVNKVQFLSIKGDVKALHAFDLESSTWSVEATGALDNNHSYALTPKNYTRVHNVITLLEQETQSSAELSRLNTLVDSCEI